MDSKKRRTRRPAPPPPEPEIDLRGVLPFDLDPVNSLAEAHFMCNFFEGISLVVSLDTTTLVITIHSVQKGERDSKPRTRTCPG